LWKRYERGDLKKVLIIEDERSMAEAVRYSLEKEGFAVDVASDGSKGWSLFESERYDMVLLDLMLPSMDGLEICRRIRDRGATPLIMMTAKDSDEDKVLGLELGADDYITKPFTTRELLARIRAVLRRSRRVTEDDIKTRLAVGDVAIDRERHEVVIRDEVVELPMIEYRLLELFLKNPGKALGRDYLLQAGWQGQFQGASKTLDVHIRRLRQEVEPDASAPERIVTVRGVGYRFEPGG